MDRLAAIRFNNSAKSYYFSTTLDLIKGDKVVVETIRGLELGEVIADLKDMSEFNLNTELKEVKRRANRADLEVYEINKIKAEKSFQICKEIVSESGLDMRMISCEYTLDASKVIFMYTADERVDFRELLKKLAAVFKCRIELRQIGPRDKAKVIGGLGTCGLPLCCNSFLGEFDGVSINMAKNQLLAINIDKISGACGRLLCCLKYEDEAYTELKKKFPKIGSRVNYDGKSVKVVGLNVISDLVKIDDNGNISFIGLDEIEKEAKPHNNENRHKKEEREFNKKPRNKDALKRTEQPLESQSKKTTSTTKQNSSHRPHHNNHKKHHPKGNNTNGRN